MKCKLMIQLIDKTHRIKVSKCGVVSVQYGWADQHDGVGVLACRDIWSRFLSFESEVGDLASILKVEKRRAQAIEKVTINLVRINMN